MIRHTVTFSLAFAHGTPEAAAFFAALRELRRIPGVKNFSLARQVSPKCDYQYGAAMEFDDADAYARYNAHPEHTRFVATHWKNVTAFLELDYVELDAAG